MKIKKTREDDEETREDDKETREDNEKTREDVNGVCKCLVSSQ